jgi:FixJ family two-component response regulator
MTTIVPKIHVIDDDDSVRQAVSRLLKAAGYEVQDYATAGEFLMAEIDQTHGCIVLDVRMPGPSGLELQTALVRNRSPLPVIFLTGHGDIRMSVRAMKAGAVDFLTKPVLKQELLAAVESALKLQARSLEQHRRGEFLRDCYATLTDREREIMAQVVDGRLNKQIATAMGIAERTVKAHRAQVMSKMQVDSLAELVKVAGMLEAEQPVTGGRV